MNDDIRDSDETLPESFRAAIDGCRQTPSAESLRRVRQSALRLGLATRSPWRVRRMWLAGAAAAIAVLAFLWQASEGTTWAQVAERLKEQPWIHGKSQGENGYWLECWYSPSRDVLAWRDPTLMKFEDMRLRVAYRYDAKEQLLVRLPQSDRSRAEINVFGGTFLALMRNEMPKDPVQPDSEVIDKQRRRVQENDKTWDEFEMAVKYVPGNATARIVYRVDPATRLLTTITFKLLRTNDSAIHGYQTPKGIQPQPSLQKPEEKQSQPQVVSFDYPKTGPVDIYDIGVPRDAKLEDRVPTDDLERVLTANRLGRERFDDYMAVVWNEKGLYSGNPLLIWRKGNRWRVELFNDPRKTSVAGDVGAWWMENYKTRDFIPQSVCDGTHVFRTDRDGTKVVKWTSERLRAGTGIEMSFDKSGMQGYLPELLSYPRMLAPSEAYRAELSRNKNDGPAGSVLLRAVPTEEFRDRGALETQVWLDPIRAYHVMQWKVVYKTEELHILEKVDRSPSGYWYPLVVRNRKTDRKVDEVVHFHLDFKADIPDSLFRPEARKADR